MSAIAMEVERTVQEGRYDAHDMMSTRRRYFKRISHTVEHGILTFVILATLLGNYVGHNYLMRDMLIS